MQRNQIKRKSDVEFHSDGYRDGHAALNVKVRGYMRESLFPIGDAGDDGFTLAWIEDHLTEDQIQMWHENACEQGWEDAAIFAGEIFGEGYDVQAEGRSSGWLVVAYNGRPTFDRDEVESWNAIDLGKWHKFAGWVDASVADIPRATAWLIGANVYEPWADEQEEAAKIEERNAISDGAVRTVAA